MHRISTFLERQLEKTHAFYRFVRHYWEKESKYCKLAWEWKTHYLFRHRHFATMTSKCNSCNNAILNADFISCAGACKEMFHIKCVAVNKSMLNAVNTCPNIHWYCHECNGGNRNISASIDRVIASIGSLTNSLSSDLIQFVNGFSTLTENLMSTISLSTRSDGQSLTASPKKCSHEGNVRSS